MAVYTLRVHTGPTLVQQMARKIIEAGVRVPTLGTEAVHAEYEADSGRQAREAFEQALRDAHGTDFGLSGNPLLPVVRDFD